MRPIVMQIKSKEPVLTEEMKNLRSKLNLRMKLCLRVCRVVYPELEEFYKDVELKLTKSRIIDYEVILKSFENVDQENNGVKFVLGLIKGSAKVIKNGYLLDFSEKEETNIIMIELVEIMSKIIINYPTRIIMTEDQKRLIKVFFLITGRRAFRVQFYTVEQFPLWLGIFVGLIRTLNLGGINKNDCVKRINQLYLSFCDTFILGRMRMN